MAVKTKLLAKTSPPKLSGIVPRKRLFNLLDEGLEKPLVWVCAQPGAGKTALIANYLQVKKLASAWYHIDSGDADPATFFHYLRLTAEPLTRSKRLNSLLPPLTPEYLPDLTGFAQRWFRNYFELVPDRFVLVFDNYQDVPSNAPLHDLLRQAAEERTQGVNIVVISRLDPPSQFARLHANRMVSNIDWEDIQLTLEETGKIAAAELTLSDETVHRLYEETQGWAAGVTLMLERVCRTGKVNHVDRGDSMETVFNYFAEMLFKQATETDQQTLLGLAHLPAMTAREAESITGNEAAGKMLESMFRRRLFVDRRAGSEIRYHFHALFRAFLLTQAEQTFNADARQAQMMKAAKILEDSNQFEAALALYQRAQDWPSSAGLVLSQALPLIQQGRWQTLQLWIGNLPQPVQESSPWFKYWLGVCDLAVNPKQSQQLFEQAYDGFLAAKDTLGQALSAAGVANGLFYEYVSFVPAGKWIAVLEDLLTREKQWPSPEIEFQVLSSFLILLVYHQPRHRLMPPCVSRMMALFGEVRDPGTKVATAAFMLHASSWWGNHAIAQRIIDHIQPISVLPELPPLFQSWWQIALCCNGNILGNPTLALSAGRQGQEIVDAKGLLIVRDKLLLYRLYSGLAAGDLALAESINDELGHILTSGSAIEVAMYLYYRAWLYLLRGDLDACLRDIDECLAKGKACGVPNFDMHTLIGRAIVLNRMKRYDEARKSIKRIKTDIIGTESPLFEFSMLTVEAETAFDSGDEARGKTLLAQAFEIGRVHGQIGAAQWVTPLMSKLAGAALRYGIEPMYAMELIKKRRLSAPSPDIENWPWPFKILTLGRFELWCDGTVYAPARKAPRKVLDLLKILVASGYRGTSADALLESLWPDLDGDSAKNTLKSTLHRLRKLLGNDDAILLRENNLSLNYSLCWVDVENFERIVNEAEDQAPDNDKHSIEILAKKLLLSYPGHFLPEETEHKELVVVRDRLRSKFRRAILRLGKVLVNSGSVGAAIEIYQRALDLDNLCEEIYQRLIELHLRDGNNAEAQNVYRRCREILSIVLGVAPSKETQALLA